MSDTPRTTYLPDTFSGDSPWQRQLCTFDVVDHEQPPRVGDVFKIGADSYMVSAVTNLGTPRWTPLGWVTFQYEARPVHPAQESAT